MQKTGNDEEYVNYSFKVPKKLWREFVDSFPRSQPIHEKLLELMREQIEKSKEGEK